MDKIVSVLSGIIAVATITALVSPGTRTPEVVRAVGRAFSSSIRAATGR